MIKQQAESVCRVKETRMMKTIVRTLAALLLCSPLLSQAQQESHDMHAMGSAELVGSEYVDFPVSCRAEVQDEFNRGVALMHSFWFAEAINSFYRVLAMDSQCAMAHWGIALSHWGNPFAGQRNAQQLARGQAAIQMGLHTASPTPRERAYLEAVAELFADNDPGSQYERTVAYEAAMGELVSQFEDDAEAQIFYALAINQTALPSDQTYAQQLRAVAILEPLFERFPNHPGIAHYIIHAYDHPPLAERALEAALRYASLAPDAPHALHMPSHTFTRIGMWQESVDTNLRSAEIARQSSSAGEELHALDYKTYAYLQMARDAEANAVVARARSLIAEVDITAVGATQAGAFAIAAIPARYVLEREDYAAAARLEVVPSDLPHAQAMTHFARAVGAARSGMPDAAFNDIRALYALRQQAIERRDDYWAGQIEIQWLAARAWVAFAQGSREAAFDLMQAAAEMEDGTEKSAVSPGPLAPVREMLGSLYLQSGQPVLALAEFEATLRTEPNRFLTLQGAADAAAAAGQDELAADYYSQLLTVAARADGDREVLQRAQAFLQ